VFQSQRQRVKSSQVLQYKDKTCSCRAVWHMVDSLRENGRSQQLISRRQSVGFQQLERLVARRRGHLSITAKERVSEKLCRLTWRRWPVKLRFHLTTVPLPFASSTIGIHLTHSHLTMSRGHVSTNLSSRGVCILAVITARCTSAVLRLHVVRLSVCLWRW